MAPICVLLHSLPWLRSLSHCAPALTHREEEAETGILWAICICKSLPGGREESDSRPEPEVVALGLPSWSHCGRVESAAPYFCVSMGWL